MNGADDKLKNWVFDSEPEDWPPSVRVAPPAKSGRDRPAARVDAAVLGHWNDRLRRRRFQGWSRKIAVPASLAAVLLIGLSIFYFSGPRPRQIPYVLIGVYGDAAASNQLAGTLKSLPAEPFDLPPATLVYMNVDSTGLRFQGPGRYAIQAAGDSGVRIRVERGTLFLAGESARKDAVAFVLETPRTTYLREGTVARLVVDDGADRLLVLEGAFSIRSPGKDDPLRVVGGGAIEFLERRKPALRVLSPDEARELRSERESLARRRSGTDRTAAASSLTIEELRVLYGDVIQVTLKNGRVLRGHLFIKQGRQLMHTSDGTVEVPVRSIRRIQAL